MGRLRGLDGLRGLAVLMVVAFHYTFGFAHVVHSHQPGLLFSFYSGQYGVELFFIISGYVILMTVERSRNISAFALARFSRLYPAFLFAVLFTAIVSLGTSVEATRVGPSYIVPSLVMVTYLLDLPSVDSSYWTLSYEFVFYAIIATALLGLRVRKLEVFCIFWLSIAYFCKFVLKAAMPSGQEHHPFPVAILTVSDYAYLFVLGMMFYRLHTGQRTRLTLPVIGLAFVPAVLWIVEALAASDAGALRTGIQHAGLTMIFAALVYVAPIRRIPLLQSGPLPWLGAISYSLYLIHQFAGYRAIDALEMQGVDPNISILLTAGIAILVASLMRHTIERPGQQLVRRMFEQPVGSWSIVGLLGRKVHELRHPL